MAESRMELFIETLTGTVFELSCSPCETIASIKAKIQYSEGIPISQQHLIWNSQELNNDLCLHDYDITDCSTLKLVLGIRGGPINTRHVSDTKKLKDLVEYVEKRCETSSSGGRPITVLVFHDGDRVHMYTLTESGDCAVSPVLGNISDSSSITSVRNVDELDKEIENENAVTREKIVQLQKQLRKLNINRAYKSNADHSEAAATSIQLSDTNNDFHLPPISSTAGTSQRMNSENTNNCVRKVSLPSKVCPNFLPLIGPDSEAPLLQRELFPTLDSSPTHIVSVKHNDSVIKLESKKKALLMLPKTSNSVLSSQQVFNIKVLLARRPKTSPDVSCGMGQLGDIRHIGKMSNDKHANEGNAKCGPIFSITPQKSHASKEKRAKNFSNALARVPNNYFPLPPISKTELTSSQSKFCPGPSYKASILSPDENALQEVLSVLSSVKSTDASPLIYSERINAFEADKKLPLNKQKKKSQLRCSLCSKRTGLATSYTCRCGKNFCAQHRYAETHNCTYDYKTEGRRLLHLNNPVITASKLPKI